MSDFGRDARADQIVEGNDGRDYLLVAPRPGALRWAALLVDADDDISTWAEIKTSDIRAFLNTAHLTGGNVLRCEIFHGLSDREQRPHDGAPPAATDPDTPELFTLEAPRHGYQNR